MIPIFFRSLHQSWGRSTSQQVCVCPHKVMYRISPRRRHPSTYRILIVISVCVTVNSTLRIRGDHEVEEKSSSPSSIIIEPESSPGNPHPSPVSIAVGAEMDRGDQDMHDASVPQVEPAGIHDDDVDTAGGEGVEMLLDSIATRSQNRGTYPR